MGSIVQGTLVRMRARPEWGPGKVVRMRGDRADVFFDGRGGNQAIVILLEKLEPCELQSHWRLDNLPAFEERAGKLFIPEGRITHEQAVSKFRTLFPNGFEDEQYLGSAKVGERRYKVAAHQKYIELLGGGEGRRLLANGSVDELVRRALSTQSALNLLHMTEAAAFRDGLQEFESAGPFFSALFDLIDAGAPVAESLFTTYVKALLNLPQPRTTLDKWTVATLLPATAAPDVFVFVKPEIMKGAAARVGFEISYESSPNYRTYKLILELSAHLLKDLKPLGARDLIDVASFLWVVAKYDEPLVVSGA